MEVTTRAELRISVEELSKLTGMNVDRIEDVRLYGDDHRAKAGILLTVLVPVTKPIRALKGRS